MWFKYDVELFLGSEIFYIFFYRVWLIQIPVLEFDPKLLTNFLKDMLLRNPKIWLLSLLLLNLSLY